MDGHSNHPNGKIYLGADTSGYELKVAIKGCIEGLELMMIDLGVFAIEEHALCEDIGREVAEKV